MINIIIADDQLLFRSMLKEILEKDSEFYIRSLCANGLEAVEAAAQWKPDIALLDIGMPMMDGIEATSKIKAVSPLTKVVLLTTFEDEAKLQSSLKYGIEGYLVKELSPEALRTAVKAVYLELTVFHKSVYKSLVASSLSTNKSSEGIVEIDGMRFDSVDISIMRYITLGKSNRDIGQLLNYSEGTIKNRISKILATTNLSDRTEISVFAIKQMLV